MHAAAAAIPRGDEGTRWGLPRSSSLNGTTHSNDRTSRNQKSSTNSSHNFSVSRVNRCKRGERWDKNTSINDNCENSSGCSAGDHDRVNLIHRIYSRSSCSSYSCDVSNYLSSTDGRQHSKVLSENTRGEEEAQQRSRLDLATAAVTAGCAELAKRDCVSEWKDSVAEDATTSSSTRACVCHLNCHSDNGAAAAVAPLGRLPFKQAQQQQQPLQRQRERESERGDAVENNAEEAIVKSEDYRSKAASFFSSVTRSASSVCAALLSPLHLSQQLVVFPPVVGARAADENGASRPQEPAKVVCHHSSAAASAVRGCSKDHQPPQLEGASDTAALSTAVAAAATGEEEEDLAAADHSWISQITAVDSEVPSATEDVSSPKLVSSPASSTGVPSATAAAAADALTAKVPNRSAPRRIAGAAGSAGAAAAASPDGGAAAAAPEIEESEPSGYGGAYTACPAWTPGTTTTTWRRRRRRSNSSRSKRKGEETATGAEDGEEGSGGEREEGTESEEMTAESEEEKLSEEEALRAADDESDGFLVEQWGGRHNSSSNSFGKEEALIWRGMPAGKRLRWAAARVFRLDTHSILALPIFLLIASILSVEATFYIGIRLAIVLTETCSFYAASATYWFSHLCLGRDGGGFSRGSRSSLSPSASKEKAGDDSGADSSSPSSSQLASAYSPLETFMQAAAPTASDTYAAPPAAAAAYEMKAATAAAADRPAASAAAAAPGGEEVASSRRRAVSILEAPGSAAASAASAVVAFAARLFSPVTAAALLAKQLVLPDACTRLLSQIGQSCLSLFKKLFCCVWLRYAAPPSTTSGLPQQQPPQLQAEKAAPERRRRQNNWAIPEGSWSTKNGKRRDETRGRTPETATTNTTSAAAGAAAASQRKPVRKAIPRSSGAGHQVSSECLRDCQQPHQQRYIDSSSFMFSRGVSEQPLFDFSTGASLITHRSRLLKARTYEEYAALAAAMDRITGRELWKHELESSLYDFEAVEKRLRMLQKARHSRNLEELQEALRSSMRDQMLGVFQEKLYSRTYIGTKVLVEEFINEVCGALNDLAAGVPQYPHEIARTVQELQNLWGTSSLVLSGGAALGLHHFGVLDVLLNTEIEGSNLLPKVVGGCSAGAVVAAWVCTRTDEELLREGTVEYLVEHWRALAPNNWLLRLWNVLTKGYMCDIDVWKGAAQRMFGDYTFLEAYRRTGRILNISMTRADRDESGVKVMNFANAPNVLIWSALLCSCAFPFLSLPMPLREKNEKGEAVISKAFGCSYFHDGSLSGDIPTEQIRDAWGVSYSIVSQVNLHVFPFAGLRTHGEAGIPVHWRGRSSRWRAGFLLSALELFFKEHIRFLLRLIALLDVSPTLRGINAGSLALQSYTGDVTLHPRYISPRYLRLLNDTRPSDIAWYLQEGRLMVFPKLQLISNRLRVDRCLERLHEAVYRACTHTPVFSD